MSAEIKPIAGMERVLLNEVVPLPTPFTVFIFPTTFCNFKCAYCGHSLGHEEMRKQYNFEPQNMSIDLFNTIIGQLKEFPNKIKVMSLTGHGEPLINPNICEMIKIAKNAQVADRIEIITNASLLTPEMTDNLIEAGLDCLRVSLQGMDSQKYLEICDYKLDFNTLINNLSYFYNHKKDCKLFVKVMNIALDNKEQEEQFYNTFRNISDRMFIEQCRPVYSGVEMTKDMQVTADRYGRVHQSRKVCPLCFFMLGIFPNGDVEPCDTIYKPIILGNVQNNSLASMWNGEKLKEFWQMQLSMNRYNNSKCSVCCAPDDVSHPEDDLDETANKIIKRIENYE